MLFATALATFLTGVTEPIEYMFMFIATPLYIIYALVQGAAFAMADLVHLRVHSFGSIRILDTYPMAINAGLALDIFNFVWVTVLFAFIMYFIANFMIKKFNYATPGRNGNYEQNDDALQEMVQQQVQLQAQQAHKSLTLLTFLVDVPIS